MPERGEDAHVSSSSPGVPQGSLAALFQEESHTPWSWETGVVPPASPSLAEAESGLERPWFVGGEPLAEHSTWFWTRVPIGWPSALSFPT